MSTPARPWMPAPALPSIERRVSNQIRDARRGAALACEQAWRASMPAGSVYFDAAAPARGRWKL